MSKMIFKKWKNIISMYFGMKIYLKSTHNHTAKHALTMFTVSPLYFLLWEIGPSRNWFDSTTSGKGQ
jgi:hypothetical protein